MRRTFVVMLDGLRRDFISEANTPHLASLMRHGTVFPKYRSAFPSATRVVSATLATGCWPARHGLAGNTMVLIEDGKLVRHDAGHPEFLQWKRHVTGKSLNVPTLAERLAGRGGAMIFNNVSPGAAYAHDPDGFGHVYHRAGSFGPRRQPLSDGLAINCDAAGDEILTNRFISQALCIGGPALGVLWMGEPDHIQHEYPLGSPMNMAVLQAADANLGRVISAVESLREAGEDVLFIAGSDHGHETVTGVIDIEAELVEASLKESTDSADVVVASNGTSALIYIHPDMANRLAPLGQFLRSRHWAGEVLEGSAMASVGQSPSGGLAFVVSMKGDDALNEYGVPGACLVAKPQGGKADRVGFGQHGGLNTFEQSPALVMEGNDFTPGAASTAAALVVDIAPTILSHLGLPAQGMDGRPLQSSLKG